MQFYRLLGAAVVIVFGVAPVIGEASEPAVEGYADYQAFAADVQALGRSDVVTVTSLAKTAGGREIYLLTLSIGPAGEKPAMLVVGGVHPPHLADSELALRTARLLAEKATAEGDQRDTAARDLLTAMTVYVIPQPSPDASESFFRRPYYERATNDHPTDDDRDGRLDEDPVEDLNGDGFITMMRVEDPSGSYMPHPDDARVMIEADAKKKERGRYILHSEGIDNDGDEKFNEDGPGGVAFNRNFTFQYPYFEAGAGPHQVSEIETRAVADFAYSRPNIAMVLTFGPDDNLMHVWEPDKDKKAEEKRIKTSVLKDDAPYFSYLAERYRKIHGGKDAPTAPKAAGSFVHWAYFHYGRWSLGTRTWWIPKDPEDGDENNHDEDNHDDENDDDENDDDENDDDEKKSTGNNEVEESDKKDDKDDKRGSGDLNALGWMEREKIDGFVVWTPVDHPDFPDRLVEVGGFKPFLRTNPPVAVLDPLAERHVTFLAEVAGLRPQIAFGPVKVKPLGGGIFRLKAAVLNNGYLPTASAMGAISRQLQRLQIELQLPQGMKLLTGHRRNSLKPIAGNGGKVERTWVIQAEDAASNQVTLKVSSPSVGSATTTFEIK